MGKKKRLKASETEFDITKGSGKKFQKKGEREGKASKVIGIIAGILAVVLVLGVFAIYYAPDFIKGNMAAVESDSIEVTQPMFTYFFNTSYQNYVSSYQSYLSYIGLDVTKDLKEQTTSDGSTWYDYFMNGTVESLNQLLVLNEAAKKDKKFDKDDEIEKTVDEAVESMKSQATQYNVSFDYYLKAVYGEGVTEKVLRKCLKIQNVASLYQEELTSRYEITEDDWNKYYEDNTDSFRKVDYMSYTFSVEATTVDDDATEADKEAASAKDKAEAERLKGLATELKATKTADEFKAYVENYLRNDKYKDMDEAALAEESIDITSLVEGCLTEGATNSSESDLNTWLFDAARKGYETNLEEADDSFTVTMILPAENSDIDSACMYRDTYNLKNYYAVSALTETLGTDDSAKSYADEVLAKFQEAKKADDVKKLCEDDYADVASITENGDKGALCDEVDEWLYDSARKAGDIEVLHNTDTGYYVVYYVGDGMLKWQSNANSGVMSDKYDAEYKTFEEKYKVTVNSKVTKTVTPVDLSSAADTSAS